MYSYGWPSYLRTLISDRQMIIINTMFNNYACIYLISKHDSVSITVVNLIFVIAVHCTLSTRQLATSLILRSTFAEDQKQLIK